jgi:Kef-type K+ transport system membrane component KefB
VTVWSDELGLKVSSLVAGLVGGVLALSMMPHLTWRRAMAAVVGGGACAAYATPIAAEVLGLASRHMENGLAFILGVIGMNILGGIFRLSEKWRDRPTLDPDKIRKIGDE